jgi:hypothetical protein
MQVVMPLKPVWKDLDYELSELIEAGPNGMTIWVEVENFVSGESIDRCPLPQFRSEVALILVRNESTHLIPRNSVASRLPNHVNPKSHCE